MISLLTNVVEFPVLSCLVSLGFRECVALRGAQMVT